MRNKSTWRLVEIALGVVLVGISMFPFLYILCSKPDKTFWDNSVGNLLATVLALIAGIPIAFMVDRFIQRRQEKENYIQDRVREIEILKIIKEELEFSYKSLFLKGKKGNTNNLTIQPLKSDIWNALSSSEEIRYIEDVSLINRITSAYYVLNLVKDIEKQAYIALRSATVTFTINGKNMNSTQLLLQDARTFDDLFEKSVEEALKAINKRLKSIS